MAHEVPTEGGKAFFRIKRVVVVVAYITLAVFGLILWHRSRLTPELVFGFLESNPVLAPLVFVGVMIFCTVFLMLALPLNLGAGMLWGPWIGTLLVVVGGVIGGSICFFIARTAFGKPFARRFRDPAFDRLIAVLTERGWKVVAFTRLNPALPFGPMCYLMGLTPLRASVFLWATTVFSIPTALAISFLGSSAGQYFLDQGTSAILNQIVLGAAILTVLVCAAAWLKHRIGRDKNDIYVDGDDVQRDRGHEGDHAQDQSGLG